MDYAGKLLISLTPFCPCAAQAQSHRLEMGGGRWLGQPGAQGPQKSLNWPTSRCTHSRFYFKILDMKKANEKSIPIIVRNVNITFAG